MSSPEKSNGANLEKFNNEMERQGRAAFCARSCKFHSIFKTCTTLTRKKIIFFNELILFRNCSNDLSFVQNTLKIGSLSG